jgi:hypothetical protein
MRIRRYLALHALGLKQYGSVIFVRRNMVVAHSNPLSMLKCISQGERLVTTAGVTSPLSADFMALRPANNMLETAVLFAQATSFAPLSAGARSPWVGGGDGGESAADFAADQCIDGFLHAFLFSER